MEPIEQNISYKDIILDTIKEPIYAIDQDYKIVVWNMAICDLTHITAGDAFGTCISNIFLFDSDDISSELAKTEAITQFVHINGLEFRTILEPIKKDGEFIGYRGGLYAVKEGILKALPRKYLVDVIDSSPTSTIVFNLDGRIMYSNNAYQEMWDLSEEELTFLNHKYNIFLDNQLKDQGLMTYIRKAFKGEIHHSPVFRYALNSAPLGKSGNQRYNWLWAYMYPLNDDLGKIQYVVLNFTDVSDQHSLKEAFQENKERLHLALKGGNLGTWDWNLETETKVYNERWAEMIGYNLEEVYKLTWENLLHPEDRDRAIKALDAMVDGEIDSYDSEFRLKTKEGDWKWILARGMVVERSAKGKVRRVSGMHIDINERKLNEEILRESEAKYRRLVENSPIGIAILVKEKVLFANESLARMGEVESIDTLIGESIKSFMPSDENYIIFKEREQQVIEKGEKAPLLTTQLKTVSGNFIDVEIVSIPINYEGQPAMQVLIHDITDRRKALYELAKNREMLNQLFENAPIGIVLLDNNFRVRNVNKGFERIFGFSRDEMKDKSLVDYIITPDLMEEAERLNKSAMRGEIDYYESYRYNNAGERVPVIIYALPVMEKDKHIGIYAIYVDIRQRIAAEEELKTRNLELDNFVYKVSHDLRAPLASILGLINLTKIETEQVDREYYIQLMEGQVNKLDYFIHDILSHSKNLKMSVTSDKVDFREIVNKCFDDLSYLKAASKVVRKISIGTGDFFSDKWRISEIFRNLIGNAIKYRNPDAKENIIKVKVKIGFKGCEIVVSDNGIGISEENLPRVMEMFYRGTEESDGSGIGLYIVQKAVEKIDGRLKIKSEPLKGTTFTIQLPTLSSHHKI